MSRDRAALGAAGQPVVALLLGPAAAAAGAAPLRPYWLALVLAYWVLEEPDRVGLGFAFLVGLVADLVVRQPARRAGAAPGDDRPSSCSASARACASSRCRSRRWRSAGCCSTTASSPPRCTSRWAKPPLPALFWLAPLIGHAAVGAVVPAARRAAPAGVAQPLKADAPAPPPAEERRRRGRPVPPARALVAFVGGRARAGSAWRCWYFRLQVLAARRIRHAFGSQPHQAAAGGAGARADLRPQGPRARRQRAGVPPRRRARRSRRPRSWLLATLSKIVALDARRHRALRRRTQGAPRLPRRSR